ncbi:alpha/beta-hydrolase [Schizopora paradoxa]|uniref:Alpha/beta-hydrolase n=1 Tax=Schizopora paradoxa TaxID=27342 RepID=A0A0H2RJQ9_9AGAM|nr:alpha/beta-hydrolase [Schizopora paradoxa]
MPFVDFVSRDDRVSLWYITNTPYYTVGSFDPEKPTIIMLPPLFLDSSWLGSHMEDPRLSGKYNIVAFDMRVCGKSDSRPSGAHDSWVDAADLAFAHQALGLPPSHVFAISNLSVNTALRFAALFPEMCLSLTLVNVPGPLESQYFHEGIQDALNLWGHPQDLEEYEHACSLVIEYMLGKDVTPELRDQLNTYWALTVPPWRRTRANEMMQVLLHRTPLSDTVLASISQPTLIIQSDKSEINPVRFAEKLSRDLVNVPGRARVHTVKGSPEYVSLIPACASIVNRVLAEFISRQPMMPTKLTSFTTRERRERMERALQQLASLTGNSAIKDRDASSPLSFSCVAPDMLKSNTLRLREEQAEEHLAFSPLGVDGRPLRRYSERQTDHWFAADREENSTGSIALYNKEERLKQFDVLLSQTERNAKAAANAPCMDHHSADQGDSTKVRMMRSTITKHVVEKATINGTGNTFTPALISSTLSMTRLKF